MKKTIFKFLAVLVVVFISSCGSKEESHNGDKCDTIIKENPETGKMDTVIVYPEKKFL